MAAKIYSGTKKERDYQAIQKYRHTAKGKEMSRKYKHSEKGKAADKRYQEKHRERIKASQRKFYRTEYGGRAKRTRSLKVNYGITLGQYDEMFDEQNGVCFICKRPETSTSKYGNTKRLSVDHNHKTGKIRALLCVVCNQNLGIYENRKKEFEEYLRKFK